MRSRAGWTTPRAKARRSSTGSLRRHSSSPGAERGGLGTVGRSKGFALDRPPPVDREVPLGHVSRAEPLARHLGAADAVDLVDPVGGLHQVVDVLGEEAGDALFDQLWGGAGAG